MRELNLNFYGVTVCLLCEAADVLESLRRDFEYFTADGGGGATVPQSGAPLQSPRRQGGTAIQFTLHAGPPPADALPAGMATFRTGEFTVYDSRRVRFVHYHDDAWATYDYAGKNGRIYCHDPERLHELAYLALLSRVGEELDRRRLHRIHALGFELDGKAGLILLPTGGGKSLLALELLRSSRMGIVSDDTPLVSHRARLLAFPIRWGFQSQADTAGIPCHLIRTFRRKRYGLKWLVDLEFFRHRVRTDLPVRWLLIGRRELGRGPKIKPVARAKVLWWLIIYMVIGKGVAQMAEYMLRPTPAGIWRLLQIAFSRSLSALKLAGTTSPHSFLLGPDPGANAQALAAFLKDFREAALPRDSAQSAAFLGKEDED